MEYKALTQTTYKFTSNITTETTITADELNPLTSGWTPKWGYIPVIANETKHFTLIIPYSSETNTGSTVITSFNSTSTSTSYSRNSVSLNKSIEIDGVTYYGTGYNVFAISPSYSSYPVQYTIPKLKLKVIKYDSKLQTIVTNEYIIESKSTSTTSTGKYYVFCTLKFPYNDGDLILSVLAEEVTD